MKLDSLLALSLAALAFSGCQKLMRDQPRYKPYQESNFFKDGNSSRPLVKGTVARGELLPPQQELAAMQDIPFAVDEAFLKRGQERFMIYCSVCHSAVGDGQGIVTQRGFPNPQTFHSDRLRNAPAGYFYNAITNGFGRMFRYGDRLNYQDRWAVVAYVRALQLSQNAKFSQLSPEEQKILTGLKEKGR